MRFLQLAVVTAFLFWSVNHVLGFSTNDVIISRTFDTNEAAVNDWITVTVSLSNLEPNDLRGFYYVDQIPGELSIDTISVKMDGNDTSTYLFESGAVGDVYAGYLVCRWILETPDVFQENNPIPEDSTAEIVYRVSSSQEGTFQFDEFHWVGYYPGGSGAAFGNSEENDKETIVFRIGNQRPVADAGATQTKAEGDAVILDGSASYDPDGTIVSFGWRQVEGTDVTLSDPADPKPTFTAPSVGVGEALIFELEVTDDGNLKGTDRVIINVSNGNQPPVVDAGATQTKAEGDTVTLDGSASYDPDGTIVSFGWRQVEGTDVTLSDPADPKPTFVAPPVGDDGTTLTFELLVTDNGGLKDAALISAAINDNGITGFPPDVITTYCSTGQPMGIKADSGAYITGLDTVDPATITDTTGGKPENLIYGLIGMEIKLDTPGGTAVVKVYLPTSAPDGYSWYKHSPASGWYDYSANVEFNSARNQVALTLIDGGIGDDDRVADGAIIDPSGLGTVLAGGSGTPYSGGGGGGCFIATVVRGH